MESATLEKYHDYVSTSSQYTKSEKIVFSIMKNLENRKGIGNELEQIDDEVFEEMLDSLILMTENKL